MFQLRACEGCGFVEGVVISTHPRYGLKMAVCKICGRMTDWEMTEEDALRAWQDARYHEERGEQDGECEGSA